MGENRLETFRVALQLVRTAKDDAGRRQKAHFQRPTVHGAVFSASAT